jgi:hypothetical protein
MAGAKGAKPPLDAPAPAPASPTPVALTGSRAHTGRARLTGHLIAGVAGWVVLVGVWAWQLAVHVPANWLGGVGLIFALLAAWVCFSIAWVEWNRSIYRRRHRRTRPIERELTFTHDALGRPVAAPAGLALLRGQLIVSVDAEGVKRFRPAAAAGGPAASEAAAGLAASEAAEGHVFAPIGEQHASAHGGRPRGRLPRLRGGQPA